MQRTLAALLVTLLGAGLPAAAPAAAADWDRPALWSGFYAGAHAGYGWSTVSASGIPTTIDPSGQVRGIHGGYNFQLHNLVFGVEGDYDWSGVAKSNAAGPALDARFKSMSTLRGRAGLAFGQLLVFGTLGYGWSDLRYSALGGLTVERARILASDVVYGGGLELKLSRNVSVRGDLLQFNGRAATSADLANPVKVQAPVTELRAGISIGF